MEKMYQKTAQNVEKKETILLGNCGEICSWNECLTE